MIDDFGPDFDAEGNELEEGESDRIRSEEERSKTGRTGGESPADEAESAADQSADEEEAATV